ncbi:MAG: hypothetical protein A2826_00425 [Candidatus Doudnabacteria bacterium RIFCSPHIGHO2_01_FULL_43_23]|uniref:Uncharacterized protein n=1 Tax=Candidatus Doudnabacteria bacterium RIFCSPHIGHO2_01_FULL_43_23 TaxID=1817822 RepID=A0A1F5NSW9_9BACT|nr:MAG: hypothetical protein A2826_00425 [Candidatus Doudnabacteria bacterium RIFCSPHIGHO2_01_FULL_43_23]
MNLSLNFFYHRTCAFGQVQGIFRGLAEGVVKLRRGQPQENNAEIGQTLAAMPPQGRIRLRRTGRGG